MSNNNNNKEQMTDDDSYEVKRYKPFHVKCGTCDQEVDFARLLNADNDKLASLLLLLYAEIHTLRHDLEDGRKINHD